jgi:hypothetical protein
MAPHRDLWSELNENHVLAPPSRHDATLTSANPAITSSGRNCVLVPAADAS